MLGALGVDAAALCDLPGLLVDALVQRRIVQREGAKSEDAGR